MLGAIHQAGISEAHEHASAVVAMKEAMLAKAQEEGAFKAVELWAGQQAFSLDDEDVQDYLESLVTRDQLIHQQVLEGGSPDNEIEAEIGMGEPLFELGPEALLARLKLLDGLMEEEERVEAVGAFHEQVLSAPTTSVADGLTDDESEMARLQAENNRLLAKLAGEERGPAISPERVRSRVQRQKLTRVGDFRREMLAPSATDVASGYTDEHGRPTTPDKITGEDKRREQERRDETLRSMGRL